MKLLLLYKQILGHEKPSLNQNTNQSIVEKRPSSFGVQGDLLLRGLKQIGIESLACDLRDEMQKEKLYSEFKPDWVVGVGYWGDIPAFVNHPASFGMRVVPWIVVDQAVLNYKEDLNKLDLILAASHWVKKLLVRDGVDSSKITTVYQGIDTKIFQPTPKTNPRILPIRKYFQVGDRELFIFTLGGDSASKGVPEMIEALALFNQTNSNWKYVIKISTNEAAIKNHEKDQLRIKQLGLENKITYFSSLLKEEDLANLMSAADIYAAPSRNEGFGRPLVEAQSCGIPVLTVAATATKEVVKNAFSGFTADVGQEIFKETFEVGDREGYSEKQSLTFPEGKLVEVRANSENLANYLTILADPHIRDLIGKQARKFAVENFDYIKSAQNLVNTLEGL